MSGIVDEVDTTIFCAADPYCGRYATAARAGGSWHFAITGGRALFTCPDCFGAAAARALLAKEMRERLVKLERLAGVHRRPTPIDLGAIDRAWDAPPMGER